MFIIFTDVLEEDEKNVWHLCDHETHGRVTISHIMKIYLQQNV